MSFLPYHTQVLQELPNLAVLNLHDSALAKHGVLKQVDTTRTDALYIADTGFSVAYSALRSTLAHRVSFEEHPRVLLFVKAVVANDLARARWHIDTGIDLDTRVGPWASDFLLEMYKTQCEGAGPFFDCNAINRSHRPTACHLATFFNAQEVYPCRHFKRLCIQLCSLSNSLSNSFSILLLRYLVHVYSLVLTPRDLVGWRR